MRTQRHWMGLSTVLGLALGGIGGCQTYVPQTTQTLPTGFYLNHLPQYIPSSPQYPLQREHEALQDASARPLPPPVPVP